MMIGKLLSKAIKVVTVPIDIAEVGIDLITGGSGSKRSREKLKDEIPMISSLRDEVCDVLEDLDN